MLRQWVALLLLVQPALSLGWGMMTASEMVLQPGQAPATAAPTAAEASPLVQAFLEEFRKRNPAIARSGLKELREVSGDRYVAVAWGSTKDQVFRGRFEDWLLGIFVVDVTLSRIDRVLEIMPTPRWGDFEIWIDTLTPYRVTVHGRGATYGDGPIRRVFDVGGPVSLDLIEADRKVVRLPPSRFPQLPLVVRRQLEAEGCRVPQSPTERGPHNVVSGQFAAIGQRDWAVLCSIEGHPSIRVFWGGYASCKDPVIEWVGPDWALLDDLNWSVVIRRETVATAHAASFHLTTPVHDAIFGQYCHNGTWLDIRVTH